MKASTAFSVVALLVAVAVTVSHPLKQEKQTVETIFENRIDIKTVETIFNRLENMLANNLGNLFERINSLTITTDNLLQLSTRNEASISKGELGDMSSRCPKGFQGVAGDRMCYYLSTYKLPWHKAQEQCFQLGSNVEPLSIRTTKMQFSVTHLIQSDADAKRVKKWWTSGHGTGADWVWTMRLVYESFLFKYWANDPKISEISPDMDSCVILDSDYFYQWRKVSCPRVAHKQQTTITSQQDLNTHHFICQVEATSRQTSPQYNNVLLEESQQPNHNKQILAPSPEITSTQSATSSTVKTL